MRLVYTLLNLTSRCHEAGAPSLVNNSVSWQRRKISFQLRKAGISEGTVPGDEHTKKLNSFIESWPYANEVTSWTLLIGQVPTEQPMGLPGCLSSLRVWLFIRAREVVSCLFISGGLLLASLSFYVGRVGLAPYPHHALVTQVLQQFCPSNHHQRAGPWAAELITVQDSV